MNENDVHYTYRCTECRLDGEVFLRGDEHDGEAYGCAVCGATVFLQWDAFGVSSRDSHADTARLWREEHGYVGCGGVVVLFNGVVGSWVNKLRNPGDWRPGCVAVDEDGKTWTAVAGSEQDGALIWLPDDPIAD